MTAKTMGLVSGEALPLCAPVVDRNDGTNGINCSITKDAKAEVLWRLNDRAAPGSVDGELSYCRPLEVDWALVA